MVPSMAQSGPSVTASNVAEPSVFPHTSDTAPGPQTPPNSGTLTLTCISSTVRRPG